MPWLEFFFWGGVRKFKQIRDSGLDALGCFAKSNNVGPKITKCATVQDYINLYAGPEYTLYGKYSTILV
jgi:hypothetical protein